MKRFVVLFSIVIIILSIISVKYMEYKQEYNTIRKNNLQFEDYLNKEVYGTDLATIINKAIDQNTKNEVKKDDQQHFIENDTNSIKIELKLLDVDTDQNYEMETFYNGGIERFVQYYGDIKFKCTLINYHKKTNKVKYLYFEQIQ